MKKILSTITLAAVLLISLTACGPKENKPLESNWKFESMTLAGQTTSAQDYIEETIPLLNIIKDNNNEGLYYINYRQNGKYNGGKIQLDNNIYRVSFDGMQDEYRVRVDGDKLTLTSKTTPDYKAIFKYTDDQILIPVEETDGPDYAKAKMHENFTIDITNDSDNEYYYYWDFYRLEIKKNGIWYYTRTKQEYTIKAVVDPVLPKQTITEEYKLEPWGPVEVGEYRIAIGQLDKSIYAYFTVNQDGTISCPE